MPCPNHNKVETYPGWSGKNSENVPLAGSGGLLRNGKRRLAGLRWLGGGAVLRLEEASKACSNRGARERGRCGILQAWGTGLAGASGEILGQKACFRLGLDFGCPNVPEYEFAVDG
jgi:hypothetical protein